MANIGKRDEDIYQYILDNVEGIGQAFADEVSRVFTKQHPNLEIVPLRANKNVQQMIQWALLNLPA